VAVALPDHPWLDRVVRGRVWIPLLGVLLAGIVAAQVEILKLGANMGRALEQTTTLTTQNEALRGSVAQLSDDQRIERLAANMGLVLPPPGAVGYLAAKPNGDVAGALANLHAPAASAFALMTAKNGAMVTGPGTSTLPPSPGAPPPPPTATTATTAATGGSTSSASSTTSSAASSPSATSTLQSGAAVTSSQSAAPATGAAAIGPSQQAGGG
jgi:hypothetical protein